MTVRNMSHVRNATDVRDMTRVRVSFISCLSAPYRPGVSCPCDTHRCKRRDGKRHDSCDECDVTDVRNMTRVRVSLIHKLHTYQGDLVRVIQIDARDMTRVSVSLISCLYTPRGYFPCVLFMVRDTFGSCLASMIRNTITSGYV